MKINSIPTIDDQSIMYSVEVSRIIINRSIDKLLRNADYEGRSLTMTEFQDEVLKRFTKYDPRFNGDFHEFVVRIHLMNTAKGQFKIYTVDATGKHVRFWPAFDRAIGGEWKRYAVRYCIYDQDWTLDDDEVVFTKNGILKIVRALFPEQYDAYNEFNDVVTAKLYDQDSEDDCDSSSDYSESDIGSADFDGDDSRESDIGSAEDSISDLDENESAEDSSSDYVEDETPKITPDEFAAKFSEYAARLPMTALKAHVIANASKAQDEYERAAIILKTFEDVFGREGDNGVVSVEEDDLIDSDDEYTEEELLEELAEARNGPVIPAPDFTELEQQRRIDAVSDVKVLEYKLKQASDSNLELESKLSTIKALLIVAIIAMVASMLAITHPM